MAQGKLTWRMAVAGFALLLGALAPAIAQAETLRLAIIGVEGLEELQRQFGKFRDVLSESTGLDFKLYPTSDRTVAIEAMRLHNLDFAIGGPSEYVIARSRTKVEPVVALTRVDYFSSIVVMAKSGVSTVKDLMGKKIAYIAIGSTSGHLGPAQLLADGGLNPLKDVEPVFVPADVGFAALKRGDIAAWGITNATYLRLRGNDKQTEPGEFRVIARGPDLPSDIMMAAETVDKATIEKIRKAFLDHDTSAKIKESLLVSPEGKDQYNLTVFLPNVVDADYEYIRKAFIAIGQPQFAKSIGQ